MEFKIGDIVRVTNEESLNYERSGKVTLIDSDNYVYVAIDGEVFIYSDLQLAPVASKPTTENEGAASGEDVMDFQDMVYESIKAMSPDQIVAMNEKINQQQAEIERLQGDLKAAQDIIVDAGKQRDALRKAADDVYQLEGSTDGGEIAQRNEALELLRTLQS